MKTFIHIPAKKLIYMVTENCCYEVVSYDEANLGVAGKIDQYGDLLNAHDLLCRCDAKLEMFQSSFNEYNSFKILVNSKLKSSHV